MVDDFAAAMGRALEQTRAGEPAEATRIIQAALSDRPSRGRGRVWDVAPEAGLAERTNAQRIADAEVVEDRRASGPVQGPGQAMEPREASDARGKNRRRSLREVVDLLRGRRTSEMPRSTGASRPLPVPQGARYERRRFSCAEGSRDYALYLPAAHADGPRGLVLMLHGCTQDADDFARGTDMNRVAERHGLIVAYPEQNRAHNAHGCWNWFRPGDQSPGRGEPEILAGLARELATEFRIEKGRVFVAGLSAGGAMAAILGVTHPELFSAVGIHSGLPHGAAHDVASAFAAMRGDAGTARTPSGQAVRTIVFHGSADPTVHASNADRIVAAATSGAPAILSRERGRSGDGRAWSRTIASTSDGISLVEDWRIDGAGHAWSGGAVAGSYTDPAGPDASAEMARFFMAGSGAGA